MVFPLRHLFIHCLHLLKFELIHSLLSLEKFLMLPNVVFFPLILVVCFRLPADVQVNSDTPGIFRFHAKSIDNISLASLVEVASAH